MAPLSFPDEPEPPEDPDVWLGPLPVEDGLLVDEGAVGVNVVSVFAKQLLTAAFKADEVEGAALLTCAIPPKSQAPLARPVAS